MALHTPSQFLGRLPLRGYISMGTLFTTPVPLCVHPWDTYQLHMASLEDRQVRFHNADLVQPLSALFPISLTEQTPH